MITNDSSGMSSTLVLDTDRQQDKEQIPPLEVHVTDQHIVLSDDGMHTDQVLPTYDAYSLENTDSDTMSNSTNMNRKCMYLKD